MGVEPHWAAEAQAGVREVGEVGEDRRREKGGEDQPRPREGAAAINSLMAGAMCGGAKREGNAKVAGDHRELNGNKRAAP